MKDNGETGKILRLVEDSPLGVKKTLEKIDISRSTFYGGSVSYSV